MGDHRVGDRVRVSDWEAERRPYPRTLRGRDGVIVGIDPSGGSHAVCIDGEVHLLLAEEIEPVA